MRLWHASLTVSDVIQLTPLNSSTMIVTKLNALIGALALTTASLFAGTPAAKQVVAPAPAPAQPLFGSGLHLGAHAVFLTPDADRADDSWGGGVNVDYFFNANVGVQVSASWADPGTSEMWHNYTADLVLRAPIESWHIAPYIFAGGGAILEDSSEFLGRAGAGLEIRPTANFGIFADWIYNFPGGGGGHDDVEDYQMVRMGVKIGF
jgi:hypothetical protein